MGRHVNAALRVCDRLGQNDIVRVDKKSGRAQVVLRRYSRPLVVCNAHTRLCIPCFVTKILAVKLAVELRGRPKMVVFGPPVCRGIGYPKFRTCIFKLHLHPTMWPNNWLSSVGRAQRLADEKRKKKERKISDKI